MKVKLLLALVMAFTVLNVNAETKKHFGIAGPQLAPQPEVKQEGSYMINGVGYTTRTHSDTKDYSREGTASYYHHSLAGNLTANGETYHPTLFTAAHKTLPLGSYAVVTNLRNNRKVIVKINDRGPFVKTRIIDLSKIAAQEIGMLNSGVAKVRVEALHVDYKGKLSGAAVPTLTKYARTEEALRRLGATDKVRSAKAMQKMAGNADMNDIAEQKNKSAVKKQSVSKGYTVRIMNLKNQQHADELMQKLVSKDITGDVKKGNKGLEIYLGNIATKADVYQLKNTLSKIDKEKQLVVYTYN